MRVSLAEQVNNELETVYFIDNVYRLDPLLYKKCISVMKENKECFAPASVIAEGGITSPGEYAKEQIFRKFAGHDVSGRRNTFMRIKEVFKRCFFENTGFPSLPDNMAGVTEFKKAHLEEFSYKTLALPREKRDLVLTYAYFSFSSSTVIYWIDAAEAADEEGMIRALLTKAGTPQPENGYPAGLKELYIRFFAQRKCVVVIENAPFLQSKHRQEEIETAFSESSAHPASQLILIDAGASAGEETRIKAEDITAGTEPAKYRPAAGRRLIYTALIAVIAATVFFFTYQTVSPSRTSAKLIFRYFADEVEQDPFTAGVVLTWTDKGGQVIKTEINHYQDYHFVTSFPENAEELLLAKGSFEVFPDVIPVSSLSEDSIRVVFYKILPVPEVSIDSVVFFNAQRWYTFSLTDSTRILITCESLSGDLSPQAAIFTDRLGKNRLLPNDNILGDKKSVEITGTLPPGKYYLKVRGYDHSTGSYRLSINAVQK